VAAAAERTFGRVTSRTGERILGMLAAAALAISTFLSLVVAPPDAVQGDVQRLMYIHVPAAWLAYLSFLVVFVASIAYLRTKKARWDRLAGASAEIGVMFTALAIVLGALWGKPIWGTWWTWDPRLTTTALLWLLYASYLLLRSAVPEPHRQAAFGAVVGIVGFADVPIVFMSIRWWRSLHPAVMNPGRLSISSEMLVALIIALAAFTLLYVCLLLLRAHVEESRRRLEEAKQALGLYAWKGG